MNNVRTKKGQVLETVKKNRDEHVMIFQESLKAWKSDVARTLNTELEKCQSGKNNDWSAILQLENRMPISYEKEYNRAIAMLELEVRDEIELDAQTFAQLIQDDWHWQRNFLASASNYSGKAQTKMSNM